MTRFVGILKKSDALMAFFDNTINNRSRHFIMPGLEAETIKARDVKNEVVIMSNFKPSDAHNSRAAGISGVSIKP